MWWVYVLAMLGFFIMSIGVGLLMGRFMALASDEEN